MDNILAAAQTIVTARRNRTPLASLAPELVPGDEAEGYRIQRAVHDLLLPQTGSLVGYKIGCTSAVMQQYLDIPHPCAGGVFAKGVHDSGAKLRYGDYVRVGVECEIAVRLARNLAPSEAPFTAEWMMEAIEAYHPAIEIVDDRYVKWETMGAPTLVADDFFAAGCVLGKAVARTKAPDLLTVKGRAIVNGKEAGRGTGADVLGHPHNALAWLANHLADEGKGLHAGQIVLTGSLVKTVWLDAGDSVRMELDGLGTVRSEVRVKPCRWGNGPAEASRPLATALLDSALAGGLFWKAVVPQTDGVKNRSWARARSKHHRGTTMDYYAGIDVSLECSSVCVVDGTGKILREAKGSERAGGTDRLVPIAKVQSLSGSGLKQVPCRNGCTRLCGRRALRLSFWRRGTSAMPSRRCR